jgi:hypothetical protein
MEHGRAFFYLRIPGQGGSRKDRSHPIALTGLISVKRTYSINCEERSESISEIRVMFSQPERCQFHLKETMISCHSVERHIQVFQSA